eukprot:TRINITY_DN43_c2_g1_i10.p1 TRINITY_DN43_c2_g1~~TRINITY_DN43_c2_g1_i10.p1  ORF type:complete len:104 (-),score=10.84 TRINITY_DN43_c2_g1_i10:356-667(-)
MMSSQKKREKDLLREMGDYPEGWDFNWDSTSRVIVAVAQQLSNEGSALIFPFCLTSLPILGVFPSPGCACTFFPSAHRPPPWTLVKPFWVTVDGGKKVLTYMV